MLNDERKKAIEVKSKMAKTAFPNPSFSVSLMDGMYGSSNSNGMDENAMVAILNPNAAFLDLTHKSLFCGSSSFCLSFFVKCRTKKILGAIMSARNKMNGLQKHKKVRKSMK